MGGFMGICGTRISPQCHVVSIMMSKLVIVWNVNIMDYECCYKKLMTLFFSLHFLSLFLQ